MAVTSRGMLRYRRNVARLNRTRITTSPVLILLAVLSPSLRVFPMVK